MCPAICEIVVPCRFRVLSTILGNWRAGSVCKVFLSSFVALGNLLPYQVPAAGLSESSEFFFFLMRRVSPLLFHEAAKVCILESHLKRRRCVEWVWFSTHPASGFPEAVGTPRLSDTIELDATEEPVAIKEDIFINCWSRFWHKSFFFLFVNPLRHCGPAYQAENLGAASGAGMTDNKQLKKIIELIMCEIHFSQLVCELVFGVNVTDLNFGVPINPIKQPIQWVLDTRLIVGLRHFIIILITASLSSRTFNRALGPESVVFDGMWSNVC